MSAVQEQDARGSRPTPTVRRPAAATLPTSPWIRSFGRSTRQRSFGLSYNTEDGAPQDHIRVVCYVTRGMFTRKYHVDMPADGKGAKGGDVMTKTHAAGAAMTYGQRYLLKMIFNIAIGDDNDGNSVSGGATVNQEQIGTLAELIESVGADKARFLKFFKVEQLAELPAKRFQEAVTMLNAKSRG